MLLNEIFAKNIDLNEHAKLILVQLFMSGEGGGNIKSIFINRSDDSNIAKNRDNLLKLGLIAKTDTNNFYIVTDAGKEAMKRASLLDDNDELIDANIKDFEIKDQN